MIKQRYIHRQITITDYEILMVNTEDIKTCIAGFSITGTDHAEKDILSLLKSQHEKYDSLIPVSIISKNERTATYKMTEEQFVETGLECD